MTTFAEEKIHAEHNQQNGHNSSHTHDANARAYILALKAHEKPLSMPDAGKWWQCCKNLCDAYDLNPARIDKVIQSFIGSRKYPGLDVLLSDGTPLQGAQGYQEFPPLPEDAQLPDEMSRGASPCLDMYMSYSINISPEGYGPFHEAAFLWALSTVAARRVRFPLGDDGYTPLMLVMCAESGLYKKTTTAKAAMKWLHAAELGWFLGAKRTTPQKLVYDMAGVAPKNFSELDKEKQEWVEKKLAFAGQRGLYFDEFGKLIKATMNANSAMADFQQLLLEMDSCDPVYDNSTISRGTELVEKPYLALLGSMTPANLRVNAKRDSEFWSDGFWARFAFVCPPKGTSLDDPFNVGDAPVPEYLIERLKEWHVRLGIPVAHVEPVLDKDNKDTGRLDVRRDQLPETTCVLGAGVHEAWKRYRSALKTIITTWSTSDLNSNYDRLPTKAIRVAALLASLENNGIIEMRHWAKAQEIAERWRRSLHELYAQVNTNKEPSIAATLEDEIIRHIYRLESDKGIHPSAADLRNYMKQHAISRIQDECDALVKAGILECIKTSHTKRYKLLPVEKPKETKDT